jgi:hypothetical protein
MVSGFWFLVSSFWFAISDLGFRLPASNEYRESRH